GEQITNIKQPAYQETDEKQQAYVDEDSQAETILIEEKKEIIQETAGVRGDEDSEADEKSAASSEALIAKEAIVKSVVPKKTESEEALMNIPEIKEEFVESSAIPAEEPPVKQERISGIDIALVIQKTGRQTAEPAEPGKMKKETITFFEEHFDENNNEWDIFSSSVASAQIKGGKYHIENKRKKGAHFVFHRHDFPHDSDFEIEVYLKAAKTIYSHSYGFVLGAKDPYNNLIFRIINMQFYLINKYHNGVQKDLNGSKLEEGVINKDSFNAMKIEKKGRITRFYINDHFIHEISDISFEGNRIGFVVEGELKISVDRIRSWITSYQNG
ncbi:MAG: hypothetical protein KAQ85_09890, partial [Thermodesulfovibrionia bacterium]|nr:hypothetical protein [Thermodesulfovibrionia bacterium]